MKKWYEHEETKVRCRQMPAPFDNIWIGSDPTDGFKLEDAQSFDAIINVSDSVCAYLDPARPDQRMHWYPINELGYWTYAPFYLMKKWYEHEETKVRCRQMPAPFDNIWIGSDPTDGFKLEDAQSFDAIINVSDSVCAYLDPARPDQRMHWYPINELGYWTYAPFYLMKHVLDYHYDRKDKIYLHCHAGAWRSPSMFRFWLLSRGLSKEEALQIEYQKEKVEDWMMHYCWKREGEFPVRIEEFYKRYKEYGKHSLYSLIIGKGGKREDPLVLTTELYAERLLKRLKHHDRWSWYYSCKYWMNERKRRYGMWKQGTRAVKSGRFGMDWVELNGWRKTILGLIPCLFRTPDKEKRHG